MSELRVGSLVYCTHQGLGILAKSFYAHGVVTDPVIVWHGRHPNHPEWYPAGTPVIADLRRNVYPVVDPVLAQVDVMLFFETPFDWSLIHRCRAVGVKTVLMPMYECVPSRLPAEPDAFLNPSALDQQYYPKGTFLPVPVDPEQVPWRKRTRCETFVHNSGHGGLRGRNGTAEVVEALRYVKSPARLILRTQNQERGDVPWLNQGTPVMVEQQAGTAPYEKLWADGDCFLFPEKFNGLSLPLQEARAAGMLVMCGDRFPMNTWLPREPLIPVQGYNKARIGPPYNLFEEAIFDPRSIAAKIDEWYGRDISEYSERCREWAAENSWEALGPKYVEFLGSLR